MDTDKHRFWEETAVLRKTSVNSCQLADKPPFFLLLVIRVYLCSSVVDHQR